jgi:hypothetical protein
MDSLVVNAQSGIIQCVFADNAIITSYNLRRESADWKRRRLWIDYAFKEKQCAPEMASNALVSGMLQAIVVEYDGGRLAGHLKSVQIHLDSACTYAVPIVCKRCSTAANQVPR